MLALSKVHKMNKTEKAFGLKESDAKHTARNSQLQ